MSDLGSIIDFLETLPQDMVAKQGFGEPASYRGYYDHVAFKPAQNVTVGEMLAHAKSAIGPVFHGYKGGDYTYNRWTPTWLATWGTTSGSHALSVLLLKYMLGIAEK